MAGTQLEIQETLDCAYARLELEKNLARDREQLEVQEARHRKRLEDYDARSKALAEREHRLRIRCEAEQDPDLAHAQVEEGAPVCNEPTMQHQHSLS